jgi:hypothetical protein
MAWTMHLRLHFGKLGVCFHSCFAWQIQVQAAEVESCNVPAPTIAVQGTPFCCDLPSMKVSIGGVIGAKQCSG